MLLFTHGLGFIRLGGVAAFVDDILEGCTQQGTRRKLPVTGAYDVWMKGLDVGKQPIARAALTGTPSSPQFTHLELNVHHIYMYTQEPTAARKCKLLR